MLGEGAAARRTSNNFGQFYTALIPASHSQEHFQFGIGGFESNQLRYEL